MATIFTKIIQGDIPSHKVLENDEFFAFMDIRPINRGHVLVVPKVEVDRFFDLPDKMLSDILNFAKPIADALETIVTCERVGIVVAGLEVPHAHLHLIPFNSGSELSFDRAMPADAEDLEQLSAKLREILS